MKILADANIVDASALYEKHGELVLKSGRDIKAADVADVDALIVRSITKVDEALLAGSRVQFVATATSGTDHFDWGYLQKQGITAVAAPGCNANAVVEFCLASLAQLSHGKKIDLNHRTVGIIGFGNVGSRLYKALSGLGFACKVCDPFVQEQGGTQMQFVSLEEVLACDIISLHTPLTTDGPHPTYHMLDAQRIQALPPGTLLINAGRGELIDTLALRQRLEQKADLITIIDCWEHEPAIDRDLLALVDIATPHIAGYSIEAKRSASATNYASFLHHFTPNQRNQRGQSNLIPKQGSQRNVDQVTLTPLVALGGGVLELVMGVLREVFPVREIDAALRAADECSGAAVFDRIRKEISQRREFAHFRLDLRQWSPAQRSPELLAQLRALGFSLC